jgi:hypothetical protein
MDQWTNEESKDDAFEAIIPLIIKAITPLESLGCGFSL